MASKRISKVNDTIRAVLSDLIKKEVKDPRIGLVSILKVDVSQDLKQAKVYFSVIGDKDEREKALNGLNSASGFLRSELGKNLKIKHIPKLIFSIDTSIEEGINITKKIEEVIKKDSID